MNQTTDSNIYSAVKHIPLKRLNLSALIVALLSKKTPWQMKRLQRHSAAPWWETWAVPPDEFSQWPPMSQLYHNDSSLYGEEVKAHEMITGSNSNLPCGRQFAGREITLNHPFPISKKYNFIAPSQGFYCKVATAVTTTKRVRLKSRLWNNSISMGME